MSELKKIKLSGSLGKRFGVFHYLAVDSYPEAIRALSSQVEGFKDYMQSEVGSRMKYAVFVDGKNIGHNNEKAFQCADEVRILPIPTGSKSGGLFQVVLGAAIMATAFFTGGASLAAMGALASSAFMMGGAMVLGGVMQMISPQQGGQNFEVQSSKNKPSYAFGGAVNTTAAGYPIPLPYGERTCGGATFSAGSYAEDMA
ncbi:tail protein [Escherichia phage vB_EcoS_IME347]|uniref:Putative tail assembly protein n=1 Tax=Escherichia phage vB_EcoS_IME347 TaxID=2496546 RepID=A0A2S1GS85_9CAUD|nr:tail protein [Escherichia phage vB_EcoS_IME347]AWD92251.1 putative tail assembly protein [Escherichia phage vB_EcoS_IME347]